MCVGAAVQRPQRGVFNSRYPLALWFVLSPVVCRFSFALVPLVQSFVRRSTDTPRTDCAVLVDGGGLGAIVPFPPFGQCGDVG